VQHMAKYGCYQHRDEKYGNKVPEAKTSRIPHAVCPLNTFTRDSLRQTAETIKAFDLWQPRSLLKRE
jgi:hypothetical protein